MIRTSSLADVVVLTAIDLEYAAVRALLTGVQRAKHPQGTVFEIGTITGTEVRVGLALVGMGNRAAATIVERAVAQFSPRAAIFVGIAGALHTDLELGDIVVASRIYALHGGKLSKEGHQARPRVWEAPHELVQEAHHLLHTGWRQRLPAGEAPADHTKVVFRPIAAGEVVVNSSVGELIEQVRASFNDTAAFDMESSGAAEAAHLNLSLPMLTIRGISDRVDGDKDLSDLDGWQQVAAANAAAFAVALIAARAEPADSGRQAPPPAASADGFTRQPARRRLTMLAAGVVCAAMMLAAAYVAWPGRDPGGVAADGSSASPVHSASAALDGSRPSRSSSAAAGSGVVAPAAQSLTVGTPGPSSSGADPLPTSIVISPPSGKPGTRFVVSGQCGPPCRQWPEDEAINILWLVNDQECHGQQLQTESDGTLSAAALNNENDGVVELDDGCAPLTLTAGQTYTLRFALYALKPGLNVTATLTIS